MESRRNELKVGVAVLISLVILVGGIMWGKGYSLKAARYPIEVVFVNVGGLEEGSNVMANGVVRGRVHEVTLREGKVYVRASVDKSVTLYSDYRITIESPTVMAGKALAIYPGSQLPPADVNQILKGESPMGMSEAVTMFENLSSDLQTALRNVNTLVVNLNRIVGDSSNQSNVSNLLADASGVAKNSHEWLVSNRERLTEILTRLDATLASADQLVKSTETRLTNTLSGVDTAAAQFKELSASLRDIVNRLQSEDGTVGKIMASDELYQRLNRTLAQVDSLAEAVRTKGLQHRIVLF